MAKLFGQRILLIGGTGGVGLAVARLLLAHDAGVILSSSRQTKVDACVLSLQSEFPQMESHITGFTCNLASPDVEANIVSLFKNVGSFNHLIYMAGDRIPMLPLSGVTLENWQKCSQVRTIASILVAKHAVDHMNKSPSSSITFTGGSICDKPIDGGWSMLAMIGAGIGGLTRQLAFDLAPLRVNSVAPGVIETDLWEDMGEEGKRSFFKEHESKIPTGKVGQPEDVAEAFLYLLKDKNATGITVHSKQWSVSPVRVKDARWRKLRRGSRRWLDEAGCAIRTAWAVVRQKRQYFEKPLSMWGLVYVPATILGSLSGASLFASLIFA